MGSCTRLRNGPVYQPHASLNSELRHCASSTFLSPFFPHHRVRPYPFLFSSPLRLFSISECPPLNVLPPQHVEELLYDPNCCSCSLEWRCIPHDVCFIHDSCFCEGSGSFPPVKPQHPSWAQFSYDWYTELAARLSLHPHSPLPHIGSEVEPPVMFFGLSNPRS